MKKTLIFLMALIAMPASAQKVIPAQSLETTTGTATLVKRFGIDPLPGGNDVVTYDIAWTSTALGAVTATVPGVVGTIGRVSFVPGSPTPTTLYDITLKDEDGFDVLAGLGGDLSVAATTSKVPLIGDGTTTQQPVLVNGTMTLAITNAGASKQGVLRLYMRR